MKRIIGFVIAAFVLSGCSIPVYTHPNQAQNLEHDKEDCMHQLGVHHMDAASVGVYAIMGGTRHMRNCLESKGWTRQ